MVIRPAVITFDAGIPGFIRGVGKSAKTYRIMAQTIKNIIFDMGGVLIDLDRQACADAFAEIGFPQAETMLSSYHPVGIFGQLERGALIPSEFHGEISRAAGRYIAPDDIDNALLRFLVGLPTYKLTMLRELRGRFGVYMLSNTNAIMMDYIRRTFFTQQGLAFDDYFDRAFLSFEMGMLKPDEAIFHRMCADGGFTPGECLFIDDGPANVEAAAALGFATYCPQPCEDFRGIFESL